MSIFDDITSAIRKTALSAAKKSTDIVDLTKIKLQISEVKEQIKENYVKLGKKCYEHKDSADFFDSEEMEDIIEEINFLIEKEKELEMLTAELKSLKKCSNCGKSAVKSSSYCSECGNKF